MNLPAHRGRPVWRWPRTAAEMAAAVGYGTWASAWQCDEASGDLADSIGSATLIASGAGYRARGALRGPIQDFAATFSGAAAALGDPSSVYDLDATTSLAFLWAGRFTGASATAIFMGKGAAAALYGLEMDGATGRIFINIYDGTHAPVTSTIAIDHNDGKDHIIIGFIERVGNTCSAASDLGVSTPASLATVGSLTNLFDFSLGAPAFLTTPDHAVSFAAVATAGVATMQTNAATAIANLRRFVGMC